MTSEKITLAREFYIIEIKRNYATLEKYMKWFRPKAYIISRDMKIIKMIAERNKRKQRLLYSNAQSTVSACSSKRN